VISPTPAPPSARERLAGLYAKVDAFFAGAAARFPGPGGITCHAGCDDCCRRRFSVTPLEAEVIAEALASLPAAQRAALAARATGGDPSVCPALEEGGRCAIYDVRPAICRTHGLPIRFRAPDGSGTPESAPRPSRRSLPVVDACPKNFAGRDLNALPAEVVLDQVTLSTMLGLLDAARAAEGGGQDGGGPRDAEGPRARVPLDVLLGPATR
jgi:Fe-S-cluster containining protein